MITTGMHRANGLIALAGLEVAVIRALRLIEDGQPGKAEYVMTRAGLQAERYLNETPTSTGA